MNKYKEKIWPMAKAIISLLTVLMTFILMIKVAGLNVLPMKFFCLIAVVIVFLLFAIIGLFYDFVYVKKIIAWVKKDRKTTENKSLMDEKSPKTAKKTVKKSVLRGTALALSVVILIVDVVGIYAINKFEDTMADLLTGDNEVEEYIIGVYVSADDKADSLEDAKRYDFGYSLVYDRNNTKKAIDVMETDLDRKLSLEEYKDIPSMVDAVLAEEKAGFILSSSYMSILEEQEAYMDISDKVKCIHECVVTQKTEVEEKEEDPIVITEDTFIVYISGHDTTFAASRANSDVNILAVVNPTTKQVLLLNTPRDYYVEISVSDEGALDKLTHCGIYGPKCSMDTLDDFYDIDINYYAQLNFKGFVRLIDAIGGITVYSEKEFVSTSEGILIQKGTNHLNGEAALEFVRERKQFGDGDNARGRHQMAVIKGIIEKVSSGSLLRNYDEVLESMGKYFKCSLSQEEITSLVKMQIGDMAEWNVKSYAVTGTGAKKFCYALNASNYVMIPDEASVEHAKTLIQMVYDGKTIEDADLEVPAEETTENK